VGEAYAEGTIPLIILSIFFGLTLISTALAGLLVVLGQTMLSLKLTALNAAIGIGAAQILLPYLGTTGAALTRGIALVAGLMTTIAALRNRIKLSFDREAFSKSLIASTVMALAVYDIQAIYYNKFYLPIYVLVGGVIYVVMLRVTNAIKPMDMQPMKEYLGPRLSLLIKPFEKLLVS
jgi:O-antigen/teichoic acid export membrane protein